MTSTLSRADFTLTVAKAIARTGYRFDKSWRHADPESAEKGERLKAAFYARCCTFAANDIADDPTLAAHWAQYL